MRYFPDICNRAHCRQCRSLVGGVKWRTEIAAVFTVPDNDINFVCPHGVPWIMEGEEYAQSIPSAHQREQPPFATIEAARATIAELGNPEWLVMKLKEAEYRIDQPGGCAPCAMRAALTALAQYVQQWKESNQTVSISVIRADGGDVTGVLGWHGNSSNNANQDTPNTTPAPAQ